MPLIEWNDETLSVGVKLIDNQHKMLVHLINKLADSIESHANTNELEAIFRQIEDYTQYHFNTEETYFFRLNTHDTDLHIKQHNHFIDQLRQFRAKHQDLANASLELLAFLSQWLCDHIQIEDKKFIQENL